MSLATSCRNLAAAATVLLADVALANEATGTEGVSEMDISGKQFAMLIGGLVVLGGVFYGAAKLTSGGKRK